MLPSQSEKASRVSYQPLRTIKREPTPRRSPMKIHVAIVSSVVVSLLWLSPLIADAKDQKGTTTASPNATCRHQCDVAYAKCQVDITKKNCEKTREDCKNILCLTEPTTTSPPK
jgi:hypothetical protein